MATLRGSGFRHALLTAVGVALLCAGVTGPAQAASTSMSGRVTAAGQGVADVLVTATGTDGSTLSAVTSGSGTYTIPGVGNGSYVVSFEPGVFSASPYLPEWSPNAHERADAVAVTVTGPTTGIDAVLERGGTIRGRVVDTIGRPLQGVLVLLAGESETSTETAADGTFAAIGLQADQYGLTFAGGLHNKAWQYWDNSWTFAGSQTVQVDAGRTVKLPCDVVLQDRVSVRGRVSLDSGTVDLTKLEVRAYVGDEMVGSAFVDAAGRYLLDALPPTPVTLQVTNFDSLGSYDGPIISEWYPGTTDPAAAQTISGTAGGQVVDFQVARRTGATISGTLTPANLLRQAQIGIRDRSGVLVAQAVPGVGGGYSVKGLPAGSYTVEAIGRDMLPRYNGAATGLATAAPVTITGSGSVTADLAALARTGIGTRTSATLLGVPRPNEPVQLEVSVSASSGTPTGSVDVTVGEGIGSRTFGGTLAGGRTQITLVMPAGVHQVAVRYNGTASHQVSRADLEVPVAQPTCTVALSTSDTSIDSGTRTRFLAKVTCTRPVPAGEVDFLVDGMRVATRLPTTDTRSATVAFSPVLGGGEHLVQARFDPSAGPTVTDTKSILAR